MYTGIEKGIGIPGSGVASGQYNKVYLHRYSIGDRGIGIPGNTSIGWGPLSAACCCINWTQSQNSNGGILYAQTPVHSSVRGIGIVQLYIIFGGGPPPL